MIKDKSFSARFILPLVSLSILWFVVGYFTVTQRIDSLKENRYHDTTHKMYNELQILIDEKKEANLLIAFSLSYNTALQKAILNKNYHQIDLHNFSLNLKKNTSFKNGWFQIIDKNGVSIHRSWTDKTGDNLAHIRPAVAQLLKKPKITTSISTGIFDLTFKAMVPIFYEGNFIGIIESIAKFNSIALKAVQKGFDLVIMVDKSYKTQLRKPFSKTFIGDYYIANVAAKKELLDEISRLSPEHFQIGDTYEINTKLNKLITTFTLNDSQSKPMAYFVLFKDLSSIDLSFITPERDRLLLFFFGSWGMLVIVFYFLYSSRYKNFIHKLNLELEKQVDEKTEALTQQTQSLDYLAHHDSLTGLPNRLLFLDRLKQSIKYAKNHNSRVTTLFLDLDRFKEINDTFGHDTGDILLQEVTKRIVPCVDSHSTVARLGGDEFMILLAGASPEEVIETTQKIIDEMQHFFLIKGRKIYTSFSIGISSFPEDASSSEILIRNADTAMYKAKEIGKNTYQFYNQQMTQHAFARVSLESDLRRAINAQEFEPYFQAQINAQTHEIIGAEALIRWNDPDKGLITPLEFIPLAEDVGLIAEMDQWMLIQTAALNKAWENEGLIVPPLSLNLSIKQLEDTRFITLLSSMITTGQLRPELLELEVTESQIMKDPKASIALLHQIKDLGLSIAIDDFGTGYSSLSYLKRLPIDKLKIDRSFIKDLPDNEEDRAIVKVIIGLAKTLNLKLIAEGVETQDQKDFLAQEGCLNIQGYYYSKPLPPVAFKKFIQDWNSTQGTKE